MLKVLNLMVITSFRSYKVLNLIGREIWKVRFALEDLILLWVGWFCFIGVILETVLR